MSDAVRALWERQFAANAAIMRGFPTHSCSVEGHPVAGKFGKFIAPYLRGRVLDIGCGPQPKALYLGDYPDSELAGIDPLAPFDGAHPFTFEIGMAEDLPWPDGSFQTAILATTLDHVLSPSAALNEIHRVLEDGGTLLVWTTFHVRAKAPDPEEPPKQPDEYHVFHLSRPWFETLIAGAGFAVKAVEGHRKPYHSAFYALEAV